MHRTKEIAAGSLFVLALALLTTPVLALGPISPKSNEQVVNKQPLLSWTDYNGEGTATYILILSDSPNLASPVVEHETTNPYYQVQSPLANGDWYWKATATAPGGADETPINHFEVIDQPSYTIIPDLSRYGEDKRVDFIIDAPLGIALELHITTQGFNLPFSTTNLKKKTFTTFLDPGSYTLQATFTQQSLTTPFTTTFTVTPPPTPEHAVTITVTDQDKNPLKDALITLEGTTSKQERTDGDGIAKITVEQGDYDCTISKEGYGEERFEKTVDEDATLTIALERQEVGTTTDAPLLAATRSTAEPFIIITSPTEQERLPTDELEVTFTTAKHDLMASCDLLFKTSTQQGWSVKGTVHEPTGEDTITAANLPPGTARILIRCADSRGETYDSSTRSIIIPEQPETHQGVASFLEEMDEAKQSLKGSEEPFLKHLNIPGRISAARKQLIDMDEQYQRLVADGKKDEAAELSGEIDELLRALAATLIIKSSIIEQEETATLMDEEEVGELITRYLKDTGMEPSAQERARRLIEEEQQSYAWRTTIAVAELELLDGTKKYVTGVTRTAQRFIDGEEEAHAVTIVESLPSSFIQVAGEPEIIDASGETIAETRDGVLWFPLPEDRSYTLLFTGNVMASADALDAVALIPDKDYEVLAATERGIINSVTGAVVSAWERVGLDTASPWALLIVIVAVAMFIINPFTTVPDWHRRRRVRDVTEKVHDVLDLIEQERHEEAFLDYPGIISSFERLSPHHQEQLSFAISNLSSHLHAHSFRQAVNEASSRLFRLDSRSDLPEIASITKMLIDEYRELDLDAKEQVKHLLLLYQEQLRTKQRTLHAQRHPQSPIGGADQAKRI
ncbi:carboxypeptidase regulatory-like domain-containing protein [Candidatus Woesearchaeota archaeon]|nr:carboxypeptidase regulatory-like domain-containing protein [Candidatus Woesearchaeota archaeon]